jgi:hypothetical protein
MIQLIIRKYTSDKANLWTEFQAEIHSFRYKVMGE